MPNPFAYAELHSQQPETSRSFYRSLFDWQLEVKETPMGEYTEIQPGEGFPGGLMQALDDSSQWLPYVRVADVEGATQRATELGGKLLYGPGEVPDVGTFSLVADPTGARFGLWEPLAKP